METVMYEYSFDFLESLWVLIPLVVGVGVFTSWKWYPKRYEGTEVKGAEGHTGYLVSSIIGWIFGSIAIIIGLLLIVGDVTDFFYKKSALESGNYSTVEGYVEYYYPMPYEGKETEHFEINGVYFEYSDAEINNGYNRPTVYGGVITGNGQHLKIKYITEEYYSDDDDRNTILYISQIK